MNKPTYQIILTILVIVLALSLFHYDNELQKNYKRLETCSQDAVEQIRGNHRVVQLQSLTFDYIDDLGLWDLTSITEED